MTRITNIQFNQFKAFPRFALHLDRTNILVGPNNSGKSTVIGALRALGSGLRLAWSKPPKLLTLNRGAGLAIAFRKEASRFHSRMFILTTPTSNRRSRSRFERRGNESCELALRLDAKAPLFVQMEAARTREGDECRAAVWDVTERKRIEETQSFLLQCGYLHRDEDFFESLARYLAKSLGMDFICIDRLVGEGLAAETVALYSDGSFRDNVEYALKDTPCGDVLGKTICTFPEAVRRLFPRYLVLQELAAESYVGTTPRSFDGKPIGLIAVIRRKPLADPHLAKSVLKLVSVRAAGELERKQAEEALRSAMKAADEANRAKSEFLAHMSHEIRTPMNGVIGMTDLALLEDIPAKAREYLGIARRSARDLLNIINDILDLARIEAGRVELAEADFDLTVEVGSTLRTLRAAAETKGRDLTLGVDPRVPCWVRGDRGRLRQVLVNLVANAIRFTEAGSVCVEVGPSDEAPLRAGAGARLLFNVSDTGIGVPPDRTATIFESFAQASASHHARFGGTGLGLAITKQLVELMGGRVWAEIRLGIGGTFRFVVELGIPETPALHEPAGAPEPPTGGGVRPLKVLLAEDNPVNQFFGREVLVRDGHEVVVVGDGRRALDALSQKSFDLVLMDVQMPEVGGLEATRLIREGAVAGVPRDVTIVAVTAHAPVGDRERFLTAGMGDYIPKPIDLGEHYRVLAEVSARKA